MTIGSALAVEVVESFCSNMLTRVSSGANWFSLRSKSHIFGFRANYLESTCNLTASVTRHLKSSSFLLSGFVSLHKSGHLLRRLSTKVVWLSNLSNLSGLWPYFLSLISIDDLSRAMQNHCRLQTRTSGRILSRMANWGILHISTMSGAWHRSHCKALTS